MSMTCASAHFDKIQDALRRIRILLLLSVACPAMAQTPAGGKIEFDVTSVKLSKEPSDPNFPLNAGNAKTPGGRLSARMRVWDYISFAYKLSEAERHALIGELPKSVTTDFYEIEARAEGNPTKDQMRLMMQSLLADRFKLATHFETREAPVFVLTLVKPGQTGPKLIPHSEGSPCPESFSTLAQQGGDVFPQSCEDTGRLQGSDGVRQVGSRNITLPLLAQTIWFEGNLAGEVDRPVVDETGLEGKFDFVIQFTPGSNDRMTRPGPPNPDAPPPDPSGTPFQNALRDQLGLRLRSSRAPIRTILIDHIESPSEN